MDMKRYLCCILNNSEHLIAHDHFWMFFGEATLYDFPWNIHAKVDKSQQQGGPFQGRSSSKDTVWQSWDLLI